MFKSHDWWTSCINCTNKYVDELYYNYSQSFTESEIASGLDVAMLYTQLASLRNINLTVN